MTLKTDLHKYSSCVSFSIRKETKRFLAKIWKIKLQIKHCWWFNATGWIFTRFWHVRRWIYSFFFFIFHHKAVCVAYIQIPELYHYDVKNYLIESKKKRKRDDEEEEEEEKIANINVFACSCAYETHLNLLKYLLLHVACTYNTQILYLLCTLIVQKDRSKYTAWPTSSLYFVHCAFIFNWWVTKMM